jgi:hypothetical protein
MLHKEKTYYEKIQNTKFQKKKRRRLRLKKRRQGWFKYYQAVVKRAKQKGIKLDRLPRFEKYTYYRHHMVKKPEYSEIIRFLSVNLNAFSNEIDLLIEEGFFKIPHIFSLNENFEESFFLLRRLFNVLYAEKVTDIIFDYEECERIDVDASVCMDIILSEFINYYKNCSRRSIDCKVRTIKPKNIHSEAVKKILLSIGAFKNISGFEVKFPDIIPFPLIKGDNLSKNRGRDKELEVTKMVDYIVDCLDRMNHVLTWEAEDDLSKVVGEILINAAEHSKGRYRYSIGYFQETKNDGEHLGIFNLTIFAFGKTIYQSFKNKESEQLDVVRRMKHLSARYTRNEWFRAKQFEEETLWTLYALQEGVTSVKDRKRGNGSIHFIESFFRLKGNMENDQASFLTLISGNTKIKFDGTYKILEKPRGRKGRLYKMMTFNTSGNIEEMPDVNFVTFADSFFPGTLISAKICIKFNNIEKEQNYE